MNIEDAKAIPPGQKLLLVTCAEPETKAVKLCFHPHSDPTQVQGRQQTYRYLGKHGLYEVFSVVSPELGAFEAQSTAQISFNELDPGILIAVGIAFGVDKTRRRTGDVLLAHRVQGYDVARVNPDGSSTSRQVPERPSRGIWQRINEMLQHHAADFGQAAPWPAWHAGTMLSGGKLIDNQRFLDSLLEIWPKDVIGGEMEGSGIAAAVYASSPKPEWAVIKAICDWADGYKNNPDKELHQAVAAWNAAMFVKRLCDPKGADVLAVPDYVRHFAAASPPGPAQPQSAAPSTASTKTPTRAPPSAASIASRAATVAQLSAVVSRLFQRPQLKGQSFVAMDGAVPECLLAALKQVDPVIQGERVVEAVVDIAEALLKAVASEELSVPVFARPAIREAMFEAIGMAAKLGLDLDLVPGTVDGDTFLVVPAELPEGATLGLRKTPHKCWAWSLTDGLPRLRDQQIERVPIETGEGQPRIDAMNRLAYKSVSVGEFVPAEISPQGLMWLRAELNNLRKQGRTQCFFLGNESLASQDLRDWAQRMQTCLIVLRPAQSVNMFLLDEVLLVGRVRHFIGLFNDKDWPK